MARKAIAGTTWIAAYEERRDELRVYRLCRTGAIAARDPDWRTLESVGTAVRAVFA